MGRDCTSPKVGSVEQAPRRRQSVGRRVAALVAVVAATAAVTATVHASLLRSGAVLTGVPVRSTVLTSATTALTNNPISTLRTATVTVPPGERHLIVGRLSAMHTCLGSLDGRAYCHVRIVIGSRVATPGPLELRSDSRSDSKGALVYEAVRGPLAPGTYDVVLQWGATGDNPIFSLDKGFVFTIEQIRVA